MMGLRAKEYQLTLSLRPAKPMLRWIMRAETAHKSAKFLQKAFFCPHYGKQAAKLCGRFEAGAFAGLLWLIFLTVALAQGCVDPAERLCY